MRILITGAGGFLGKNLISHLKKKKFKILLLNKTFKNLDIFLGQKFIVTKIEKINRKNLLKIKKFKPEVIINLAWEGIPNFSFNKSFKNLSSQIIFFQKITKIKSIKKIINIGSCWEYPKNIGKCRENEEINLQNFFIWAKISLLNFIEFCCKKKIKYIWFRVFFMYGPFQRNQSLIPSIFKSLSNLKKPKLLHPNNSNDFIHVDDVCSAIIKAIEKKSANGIFNVGSGKLTNVLYIYKKIIKEMNLIEIKKFNISNINKKNFSYINNFACLNKIQKELRWKPLIDIDKGIKSLCLKYKKNEKIY